MAARSDAATDRVSLSSAPSPTAWTIGGWAQIVSAAASSFNPSIRLHSGSGGNTAWILGFKGSNGRNVAVYSASNPSGLIGAEIALNTWVYIAATLGAAGACSFYYGTTPGSLTKITGTVASGVTPDGLTFFGRSPSDGSEWLNGALAYWRIWTAVLTDAEIAAESQSATPVRTGAWASWDFAAAALTDGSGNSRTLAAGTTPLAADTDPPLGGTQNATLTATATAQASVGAFTTRPAALTAAAVAQTSLTPASQRQASMTVAATSRADLSPFANRAPALDVAAMAQVGASAYRTTASTLNAVALAEVDAIAAADRTTLLDVAAAAAADLAPHTDRAAALDAAATAGFTAAPEHDVQALLAAAATAAMTAQTQSGRDRDITVAAALVGSRITVELLTTSWITVTEPPPAWHVQEVG
ncbi:LamG domain-containing protein [Amycolatopsis sp. FU40]|uniref:LamG domain-containing protein n=1 Tax=Amycolatopsis sp. FU40 TaxID=2914159 RepID=UPI001F25F6AB|nr:LamG domain-containing protein [Amycolatopsis sp. FU40]UKD55170.1 LamG domain-containing protein [Amycolatopsis sp. FU40]